MSLPIAESDLRIRIRIAVRLLEQRRHATLARMSIRRRQEWGQVRQRGWMLIFGLAIAGFVAGARPWMARMRQLSAGYQREANDWSVAAAACRNELPLPCGLMDCRSATLAVDNALLQYATQMHRKYELAASFPWMPLESDPPPPQQR
jgi:hypothetical protein